MRLRRHRLAFLVAKFVTTTIIPVIDYFTLDPLNVGSKARSGHDNVGAIDNDRSFRRAQ